MIKFYISFLMLAVGAVSGVAVRMAFTDGGLLWAASAGICVAVTASLAFAAAIHG